MNTFNYVSRNAITAVVMSVVLLSGYAAIPATAAGAQSDRVAVRSSAATQSVQDSARLIIRRIPNLGNNVIVDVYLDGVAFAAVGYGHTYEGTLPAGRHVLSVLPAPAPVWRTPSKTTLNVRDGETYTFTAVDDDSGDLILKAD